MSEQVSVLVVDDDRRMVKTISDILLVKGYSVKSAFSGEEAVEMVRTKAFDCVLMDLKMEGMTGIETLKELKKTAPELPVIMMSAFATDEQLQEARRDGAYSVLTKPVDIQLVLSFLSLLRREQSVLIVDDDPGFSKTLKDILEARGCSVETEGEAGKVLERMENEYKLVVILELKLAGNDGINVLENIRARYPTKPVVLVTGYRENRCLYLPLQTA
jgi:CheY-like chemotaxis protein